MGRKNKKTGDRGKLIRQTDTSAPHASSNSQLLPNNPPASASASASKAPTFGKAPTVGVHIALVIFLILIVYSNSLKVPFQVDEEKHIVNNPFIKDIHNFVNPFEAGDSFITSRYIPHLTFALNYRMNGIDVTGYHIVNNAIHIANAILVYFLVLMTFKTPFFVGRSSITYDLSPITYSRHIALFSSLIFAAHPLQTAAVTYIMQRFASLVAFFYLLSLTAYIKSRLTVQDEWQKGKGKFRRIFRLLWFYSVALISAVLAMKTKENAFTLPLIIVLYEFCFFNGGIKKRMIILAPILLSLCIIPLTLMSFTKNPWGLRLINPELLAAPGSYMASFTWNYSHTEYFLTQLRVIVTYLRMLFFPANMGLTYEYPVFRTFFEPQVMLSFIFLAALFGFGVYMIMGNRQWAIGNGIKTKGKEDYSRFTNSRCFGSTIHDSGFFRLIGFGILWFFITLSVESVITTPRLIETYRVYLPSVGAIISTVTGVFLLYEKVRSPRVRVLIVVMLFIIIGGLSVATYLRNEVYKDKISSYEGSVMRFPASPMMHNNLGNVYAERSMYDKAMEQYLIAIKLKPDYIEAHTNLGNVYEKRSMYDKAMEQYLIAIKLKPDNASIYNNIGTIYQLRHMPDKAIEQCLIAIKLKPDYADPHFNLGVIYYNMGQKENAKKEMMSGLKIMPDNQKAQQFLNEISGSHPRADD